MSSSDGPDERTKIALANLSEAFALLFASLKHAPEFEGKEKLTDLAYDFYPDWSAATGKIDLKHGIFDEEYPIVREYYRTILNDEAWEAIGKTHH